MNTPTKTKGLGAGQASDLRWVEACAEVAQAATSHTIVVEKSTLPVRTAAIRPSSRQPVTQGRSAPFRCFQSVSRRRNGHPRSGGSDRVLIGVMIRHQLMPLHYAIGFRGQILRTNLWSSELSSSPPMRFWRSGSARSTPSLPSVRPVGRMCVRWPWRLHRQSHRSEIPQCWPGFGGSCFRSILNLVYLCRHFGLPEVADYWRAWWPKRQQQRIAGLVVEKLLAP